MREHKQPTLEELKKAGREELKQIFYALIEKAENEAMYDMEENDYEVSQGTGEATYDIGYITEEDLDGIYDIADDCGAHCWLFNSLKLNPNQKYYLWIRIDYDKFNGFRQPTWGLRKMD